jgi:hypothetical protein
MAVTPMAGRILLRSFVTAERDGYDIDDDLCRE